MCVLEPFVISVPVSTSYDSHFWVNTKFSYNCDQATTWLYRQGSFYHCDFYNLSDIFAHVAKTTRLMDDKLPNFVLSMGEIRKEKGINILSQTVRGKPLNKGSWKTK